MRDFLTQCADAELSSRGVELEEIHHFGPNGREPGLDSARGDFGSYSSFADPDGNMWVLQEVPSRPT